MNITLNTKIAAIVGGVIAAGVIIGGGYVAHNNHKVAEAKKAAELAHANRPIIAFPDCIMNGHGKGDCKFTNTGKTAGAQCGYIEVEGPGVVKSEQFCSGMVQSFTTNKVEFDIPPVNELCDNGFESWTEKCEFTFIPSGGGQNSV